MTAPEWGGIRCDPAALNQKGKTMQTETYNDAVESTKHTLGNKLKFKLEFMVMMLHSGRTEEAGKMYNQLIEEFDKLA